MRDDDDAPGPSTLSSELELMQRGIDHLCTMSASPSWRPIRRPVARCEYCGRISQRGEVQCAGCGAMR